MATLRSIGIVVLLILGCKKPEPVDSEQLPRPTRAAPVADSDPAPAPTDGAHLPEDFVNGAAQLTLGMTEAQVSKVLGLEPGPRKAIDSRPAQVDAVWLVTAEPAGKVHGWFVGDRLVQIVATLDPLPALPSIEQQPAREVIRADFVQRAIDHTLRLEDVAVHVGASGARVMWSIAVKGWNLPLAPSGKTEEVSEWRWHVQGDEQALAVTVTDDGAGQPIFRALK